MNCECGFEESELAEFRTYFNQKEDASAEEFAVENKSYGACQYSMHACQYSIGMERAASVWHTSILYCMVSAWWVAPCTCDPEKMVFRTY